MSNTKIYVNKNVYVGGMESIERARIENSSEY